MGVAEDPRLAAGLRVARHAALVDRHRGALLGQRERGRQPDDAGADDRDVGPISHASHHPVVVAAQGVGEALGHGRVVALLPERHDHELAVPSGLHTYTRSRR